MGVRPHQFYGVIIMANKAELIEQIAEAAKVKGVDVPNTEGLKNAELEEVLTGLLPEPDPNADPDPEPSPKTKEAAKKKKPPYSVAKGKSIACKKGIVGSECEMKVEYVAGGKKSFDALVDAGHIVKN